MIDIQALKAIISRHMSESSRKQFFSIGACDQCVEDVLELVDRKSFSKAITADGKNCPTCGRLWVVSRRYLPKYLMDALRILADSPRAMTTKELFTITDNRQVYTKFAWLVHWGLIEKRGKEYIITEKGLNALHKKIKVEEFLWMLKNKVVATPEGEESPALVFIDGLRETDTDDHAEHVSRSAPVL